MVNTWTISLAIGVAIEFRPGVENEMDRSLGKLIGTKEAAERRAENQEGEDSKQGRKRHMARHGPAVVQTEVP